jgi:glutamate-1-semialdehyde 2,1-aminomutase
MAIEQAYVEGHPRSRKLYQRASRVLPSGVTHDSRYMQPFPIYVERAAGPRKWDVDGHEYVDYVMGHGALLLGHNHPIIEEAASAQLKRGTHYGASQEREVEWAEEVVRLVPSAEVVRFTSSGTEATLMALRLARAYAGKPGVIKFERHFHGWHDYVVGSSKYGGAAPAGVPETTLESVAVVAPEMAAVREVAERRDDLGAVIVEAAGASTGTVPLTRGFLRELEAFARAREMVLIMDEVVTGFRWAAGGVQQLEGVRPDLTALAKILAGGLPGGAVAGRREIMDHLAFGRPGNKHDKVGHPGTFNANPLSAAAGVACLREVGDGEHQAIATATAAKLRAGMNAVMSRLEVSGCVYGQASDLHIIIGGLGPPAARDLDPRDLDAERLGTATQPETQRLLNLAMLNRGVHIFGNAGFSSSVHDEEDVQRTLDAWEGSLREMREEGLV